jgi:hypothetical protein
MVFKVFLLSAAVARPASFDPVVERGSDPRCKPYHPQASA